MPVIVFTTLQKHQPYIIEREIKSEHSNRMREMIIRNAFGWDEGVPVVVSQNGQYFPIERLHEASEGTKLEVIDPHFHKEIKTAYSFAVTPAEHGRTHAFTVSMKNGRKQTGDALKTALLKELVSDLEQFANDPEALKTAYLKMVKDDPRYKVLKKGQGIVTRFFRLETDSCKALKGIYQGLLAEAEKKLNEMVSIESEDLVRDRFEWGLPTIGFGKSPYSMSVNS